MSQNIIHVGLDVDELRYRGSATHSDTGEVPDFRCLRTLRGLVNQLEKVGAYFGGAPLKLCYGRKEVRFGQVHCLTGSLRMLT